MKLINRLLAVTLTATIAASPCLGMNNQVGCINNTTNFITPWNNNISLIPVNNWHKNLIQKKDVALGMPTNSTKNGNTSPSLATINETITSNKSLQSLLKLTGISVKTASQLSISQEEIATFIQTKLGGSLDFEGYANKQAEPNTCSSSYVSAFCHWVSSWFSTNQPSLIEKISSFINEANSENNNVVISVADIKQTLTNPTVKDVLKAIGTTLKNQKKSDQSMQACSPILLQANPVQQDKLDKDAKHAVDLVTHHSSKLFGKPMDIDASYNQNTKTITLVEAEPLKHTTTTNASRVIQKAQNVISKIKNTKKLIKNHKAPTNTFANAIMHTQEKNDMISQLNDQAIKKLDFITSQAQSIEQNPYSLSSIFQSHLLDNSFYKTLQEYYGNKKTVFDLTNNLAKNKKPRNKKKNAPTDIPKIVEIVEDSSCQPFTVTPINNSEVKDCLVLKTNTQDNSTLTFAHINEPTGTIKKEALNNRKMKKNVKRVGIDIVQNTLNKVLANELVHKKTHVPFYHGCTLELILYQDLLKIIYPKQLRNCNDDRFMLRLLDNDFPNYKDITDFFKKFDYLKSTDDHNEDVKKVLISVNAALLGNHYNLGSNTFYYFLHSISHIGSNSLESQKKALDLIEQTFRFSGHSQFFAKQKPTLEKLLTILAQRDEQKTGALLQISIPKENVNQIVYPAQPLGYPRRDKDNNVISASKALETQAEEKDLKKLDQTEYRLLINTEPLDGIKIYRYGNKNTVAIQRYKQQLKLLANILDTEITNYYQLAKVINGSRLSWPFIQKMIAGDDYTKEAIVGIEWATQKIKSAPQNIATFLTIMEKEAVNHPINTAKLIKTVKPLLLNAIKKGTISTNKLMWIKNVVKTLSSDLINKKNVLHIVPLLELLYAAKMFTEGYKPLLEKIILENNYNKAIKLLVSIFKQYPSKHQPWITKFTETLTVNKKFVLALTLLKALDPAKMFADEHKHLLEKIILETNYSTPLEAIQLLVSIFKQDPLNNLTWITKFTETLTVNKKYALALTLLKALDTAKMFANEHKPLLEKIILETNYSTPLEAIQLLVSIFKQDPLNNLTWATNFTKTLINNKKFDEAIELLETINTTKMFADEHKPFLEAIVLEGRYGWSEIKATKLLISIFEQKPPKHLDWITKVTQALIGNKKFDSATWLLKAIAKAKMFTDDHKPFLEKIILGGNNNESNETTALLTSIFEQNPSKHQTWVNDFIKPLIDNKNFSPALTVLKALDKAKMFADEHKPFLKQIILEGNDVEADGAFLLFVPIFKQHHSENKTWINNFIQNLIDNKKFKPALKMLKALDEAKMFADEHKPFLKQIILEGNDVEADGAFLLFVPIFKQHHSEHKTWINNFIQNLIDNKKFELALKLLGTIDSTKMLTEEHKPFLKKIFFEDKDYMDRMRTSPFAISLIVNIYQLNPTPENLEWIENIIKEATVLNMRDEVYALHWLLDKIKKDEIKKK